MIDIENTVSQKFPTFANQPDIIRKPTISLLRKLSAEERLNNILSLTQENTGLSFVDELFDYFDCGLLFEEVDLNKIPQTGALLVIANHPTGSLDGLALIKLISKVRQDIKIVADNILMNFKALNQHVIPAHTTPKNINPTNTEEKACNKHIKNSLKNEEVVIIFPAKDVSRAGPSGLKDRRWSLDFLTIIRETKAPTLPILVDAKNSFLFYCISFLFTSFSRLLLTNEMTRRRGNNISLTIGEIITHNKICNNQLKDRHLAKRLKKHLYKLPKHSSRTFITEKPIAKPEKTRNILRDLSDAETLGKTRDKNTIYLANYRKKSSLIKEIGRLREFTFRKVGEGTGSSRDLDSYDKHYQHLTLWNNEKQEVVGAYRIANVGPLIKKFGINGLYTSSLYQYSENLRPKLDKSLELGRSFILPNYWGKQSLDYLWQGIGAFIKHNPDIRYLIGPVSMSADYPKALIDELVFYFESYYGTPSPLVKAYNPYTLSIKSRNVLQQLYIGLTREQGMEKLQQSFKDKDYKIPVLFKQYTSIYEEGGIQLLAFSVDPDFGDCIDGLLIADLNKLKPKKRERYIEGK
jgi:putative hemolysin